MSEYNDHNSLYDNSEYPSRRRAPGQDGQSGRSPRKSGRSRRGGGWKRGVKIALKVLGTMLLVGLCTGALLCCFAAVYINQVIVPIADMSIDDFSTRENSIMYYQDKTTGEYRELGTVLSVTKTQWVEMEDMPAYLPQAAVAIEDKRFYTHPGVDWKRTAKAVLDMFLGNDISGGSTITQQLIKNTTGYKETTVKRKITEIVRAIRLTQNNSKDDVLEYYLNIIPLGAGCEGVGAASLEYFGKPVSELTLAECASLVGITNNPSRYSPYSSAKMKSPDGTEVWTAKQWNKYRQEVILYQMLDQKMISQAEYDEAVAQELVFARSEGEPDEAEVYGWYEETVISDVREALMEKGYDKGSADYLLQYGGLRIYTCYDPDIQQAAEAIYTDRENLNYKSNEQWMQSSITVIDNTTGDVVAIVGQFGEKTGNLWDNFANDGHRQPGSSLKPLSVYSPALEMGKVNPYSVLDDYPYQMMGGKAWPLNSGGTRYRGHVTVEEALKRSINTIAVRILLDKVTAEESFNFVQDRYHIDLEEGRMIGDQWTSDIGASPLAMGGLTDGTNTRDMAEAYATFPNNGVYTTSRTFTKVTQMVDGSEELLIDNTLKQEPVIKETTAYYMNDMLQNVFASGGTAAGKGIRGQHAGGKTGTTSDNKDRWFVGYTPYYTAAVWTGYVSGYKITQSNPAVPLWNKVMTAIHQDLPNKDYANPGGQRKLTYCMDSGLIAGEYCALDPRGSRVATGYVFPEDFPEGQRCTFHTAESVLTLCKDSPILAEDGTPTERLHLAGPFCPVESQIQICYPNFTREQVGSAVADDSAWLYEANKDTPVCDVHLETPVEEPDPNVPGEGEGEVPDPNDPSGEITDPPEGGDGGSTEPEDPGGNGGSSSAEQPAA